MKKKCTKSFTQITAYLLVVTSLSKNTHYGAIGYVEFLYVSCY